MNIQSFARIDMSELFMLGRDGRTGGREGLIDDYSFIQIAFSGHRVGAERDPETGLPVNYVTDPLLTRSHLPPSPFLPFFQCKKPIETSCAGGKLHVCSEGTHLLYIQ